MPRIGLLSDTHGWLDPRLREHFAACDEIWHAGDIGGLEVTDELQRWFPEKTMRAIVGNIDDATARRVFPEDQRFELDGVRVWITHIGGRPPRYEKDVLPQLRSSAPNLFICGHSHICMVKFDEALNMLYMNPGACGKHGWHQMRTVLRFTIEAGKLKDLEVVELGETRGNAQWQILSDEWRLDDPSTPRSLRALRPTPPTLLRVSSLSETGIHSPLPNRNSQLDPEHPSIHLGVPRTDGARSYRSVRRGAPKRGYWNEVSD